MLAWCCATNRSERAFARTRSSESHPGGRAVNAGIALHPALPWLRPHLCPQPRAAAQRPRPDHPLLSALWLSEPGRAGRRRAPGSLVGGHAPAARVGRCGGGDPHVQICAVTRHASSWHPRQGWGRSLADEGRNRSTSSASADRHLPCLIEETLLPRGVAALSP
jgi:hypothetical protein